jgi:DNA-binding beta-propeller fold protein YncE
MLSFSEGAAPITVRCLTVGLLVLAFGCSQLRTSSVPHSERRLYVAHKSRLTVYDIDRGHEEVDRIDLAGAGSFKGIGVSIPLRRLYVTSSVADELIALDLETKAIVWRKKYCAYLDSFDLTADGRTLYVPCRHAGQWVVVNAADGVELGRIETGRGAPYTVDPIKDYGPHNTVASVDGRHVYLAAMTIPFVFEVDAATRAIIRRIGPFTRGVRPFAVAERYLFANIDGLLGFEVADLSTGKVIHRVEARTPQERLAEVKARVGHHHTPSHGVAVRPGGREVWISDDVYGYVHVFDITSMPPRAVASIPLFRKAENQPKPGWITFSLDGRLAYLSCNVVVDAERRAVIARFDTSERLLEVHFEQGHPVRAGRR